MRILHVLPHLSKGGAERQFSYLAPELVRMGHDVHVAYSTEGPQRPELSGVVLHQLKSRSNYDPYLFWQLMRIIRRIKPDVIHTWIFQMHILGGIAARLSEVPWILREPGQASTYLAPTWKHRLRVWVGSGANAIVSNSLGGDDFWKTKLPNNRRYIVVNGLPAEEIDRTVAELPPGLAPAAAAVILFAGRFVESEKRPKNFLYAIARVRQEQNVSGVLCGDGPQLAELAELQHKLGLDTDVHFTGYLPAPSVWELMKKAAVFVSLSAFEGHPNTVMEAMRCACPLVLSDIPAHREILDESCALFVDARDIQQIADAILQVLRAAAAAKARALIARQKTQEWTIAKMAQNYERVYYESSRKSK